MAGKARKHPKVRIAEDKRRMQDGQPERLLVWEVQGKRTKESIGYVTPEEAEELREDKEAVLRAEALGLTRTSPPSTQPERPATVADAVEHYLALLPTLPGKPDHHRWERTRSLHLDRLLGEYALTALTSSRLRGYVKKRQAEPKEPRKRKSRDEVVPQRGERRRKLPPASTAGPRRATVFNEVCCLRRVVKSYHESKGTAPPALPKAKEIFAGWDEDHRPPRQLTEAEVRALVAAGTYIIPSGTYAGRDRSWVGRLVGFLAWCPRRPFAVFGLRIRNCDRVMAPDLPRKERRALFERDKGGKGRGLSPLSGPALRFLREQVEARVAAGAGPDDLVWVTEAGREWTAQKWWRVMQTVAKRAELTDVTTYDLRKFGAAQVYRRKPNLKVVMAYTGHKNPSVLLKNYIFPERDEAEEAAEGIEWSAPVVRLVEGAGADEDDDA